MTTDVLVLGAGVAGLAAALGVRDRRVVLVSEMPLGRDLASAWAQGGLAAALGADDAPALHARDTIAAGGVLVDDAIAALLADEAPAAIEELIALGVAFTRADDGALEFGLEGAHGRRRIVHVDDATGAAVTAALIAEVRKRDNVRVLEGLRASALLQTADGAVCGASLTASNGEHVTIRAQATVLATGGFGGLFARTTTPLGALGSGIALAGRAGATLCDLEFVQFHPTALRIDADPLPLVSEAVRGEGAVLIDEAGRAIMSGVDARGELAPRDVVARAISDVERAGGHVALDARAALGAAFPERFPGIFATAMRFGIDPRAVPLPLTPVAHYTIGGVQTDCDARTNVPGLWACGEVASTGLHGANRLASNSLVEGLVFGARAARDITAHAQQPATRPLPVIHERTAVGGNVQCQLQALRSAMSAGLGVVRDAYGITRAASAIDIVARIAADARVADAAYVAVLVAEAALARCESRGAHQRLDYPLLDAAFEHHSFATPAALPLPAQIA